MDIKDLQKACSILGLDYNQFIEPPEIEKGVGSIDYKTLYKDVITLEDKVEILEIFEEQKGIDNELKHLNRLF